MLLCGVWWFGGVGMMTTRAHVNSWYQGGEAEGGDDLQFSVGCGFFVLCFWCWVFEIDTVQFLDCSNKAPPAR